MTDITSIAKEALERSRRATAQKWDVEGEQIRSVEAYDELIADCVYERDNRQFIVFARNNIEQLAKAVIEQVDLIESLREWVVTNQDEVIEAKDFDPAIHETPEMHVDAGHDDFQWRWSDRLGSIIPPTMPIVIRKKHDIGGDE